MLQNYSHKGAFYA